MSIVLVKGQKADLTRLDPKLRCVNIELSWHTAIDQEIDASAFLAGSNGKVLKDSDFVFYGQTSSGCSSVIKKSSFSSSQSFQVFLNNVPSEISKIVFSLTIYQKNGTKGSFRQVSDITLSIVDEQSGKEYYSFPVPNTFSEETAIVVGDLYRHSGEWKFNSVGAGYFGGLASLCQDFGVEIEEETPAQLAPKEVKSVNHIPEPISKKPASKINFSKIELKKKQSVNIQKSQRITAVLEWESNKDLDLYCFYVTKTGFQGKIYYKDLGSSSQFPFIRLDGDSQKFGTETIEIYRTDELSYVMFAAYSAVGNGIGSFKSMKAKAVVDNHMGNVVVAPLLERNDLAYWVAIAHIDFTDSKAMKVSHVERYSRDHSEASPLLYSDGSFRMDVGPIEFKNDQDYNNYFGN